MSDKGTLQLVGENLALAVEPLREAVSDLEPFRSFMYALGWDVASLPPSYAALGGLVDDVLTALDGLSDDPTLDEVLDLLTQIREVHDAIKNLGDAPAGVDAGAFLAEIGDRLFELLLVRYLAARLPWLYNSLELLDVIELERHQETPTRPGFIRTRLRFDKVPELFSDPGSIPRRVYRWGTDDFDFTLFGTHLQELALALQLPAAIEPVDEEADRGFRKTGSDREPIGTRVKISLFSATVEDAAFEVAFRMMEFPAEGSRPAGFIVQPVVPQEIGTEFPLSDTLTFSLRAGTNVASLFGIIVRSDGLEVRYPFQEEGALPAAGFGVRLGFASGVHRTLLGSPKGSRLEVADATIAFELDTLGDTVELVLSAVPNDLALILAAADQDGFLNEILHGDRRIPIPLAPSWSSRHGMSLAPGGADLEFTCAPHLTFGPIEITQLQLGIRGSRKNGDPVLATEIGASLRGQFGPFAFAVDGLGVGLIFTFGDGNAGPFDVAVGFKAPDGLGLVLDASAIKGGGFLSLKDGEYVGAIELLLKDQIAIKAIAILTTKLPGGQPGFSLLLIITAQFQPIQLSFGFVLTGVGGLIGAHRTMVVDVLRAGIRNRTIDSIMFAPNPVQNAPKIISDLKAIFPPVKGRFVLGPMLEIGWGTPVLVTARIGVFIELPTPIRIAVLGQVKAGLPTQRKPFVKLNLDAVGIIEFEKKNLAIDATLYDSELVGFPLAGDMALRLNWAGVPNFALAVGGLNPRFTPPPGFPLLRRLSLTMGSGNNPRLGLETYMALTSNTAQFGARLELRAESGGFAVHGHLGFDALFVLSPFSFVTDISAGVDLLRGTSVLMSVRLDLTLSGPIPWHAWGKASVKILFITISVRFDKTWGLAELVELLLVDAKKPLLEALGDPRNWSAALPRETELGVSLAEAKPSTKAVLVHPLGRLSVAQKVVPFNLTITKFGNAAPATATHFTVAKVALNGSPRTHDYLQDYFAPGQFKQMDDAAALAAASFKLMDVGVGVGASGLAHGRASEVEVVYSTHIIDNPVLPSVRLPGLYRVAEVTYLAQIRQSAGERSPVRTSGEAKFSVPGAESAVRVREPEFVIVSTNDLAVRPDLGDGGLEMAVRERLEQYVADHPEQGHDLQAIPRREAVSA